MKFYEAIVIGREVVIIGLEHENSAVFWKDGDKIMTWTRELGAFERSPESFPPEKFESHCKRMLEEGAQVFIRG